jgi:hypothetical protein
VAIAAGAAVAVACAFVVGLIGGATNTQFAYGAVLIGFLAGLVMRKIRMDAQTAIAGAVVALIGSALSSVIALTLHVVKAGQIPLSFVLGHESTLISDVPHYIGFFGFLCWAIAAYVGWATASGRGRRRRYGRMRGAPATAGQAPYGVAPGQAPPYGAAPGQAPYGTGPGQAPPYGAAPGQAPYGTGPGQAPPYGAGPGQAPYGTGPGPVQDQPGWGATDAQTGYGFTAPPGQAPDTGTDQPPGGPGR